MTNQAVPFSPPSVLSSPPLSPVDGDQRLHTLDILRGLALFGMILVHFHQKMRIEVTGLEDLIGWGVWILVEQKAWGIFAFLFGVGFAVLLRRLEARKAPVVAIYLRRLAALAGFGVIAEVGFGFSILLAYAAWGLFVLFALSGQQLAITKWAGVLMNFALGFSSFHTLAVNLILLPKQLRPGWFLRGSLVFCGIFFMTVSALGLYRILYPLG